MIDNTIKLQVLKDVLTSNLAFNKSAVDFRILCYNEKWRKMMKSWREKTIYERLRDIKEIYSLIYSYNGTSKVEKKLKGEVFTPFELVEEMLNTLSKEFWEILEQKILEPANGTGVFVAVLVKRFMYGFKHPDGWETKGLSELIKNEEDRYKWIMEEIIHVVDIQPKNMFIYREIFDPEHKLKLKYYTGSFLDDKGFENKMKEWKVEKFTLICGNPPYNWSDGENQRKNNRENLWTRFVFNAIDLIENMNYLSFVVPKTWMSPSADFGKKSIIKDIMIPYNPIYINIDDCSKHFNVGSTFSFFTIQKSENQENTKIKTDKDEFIFSFIKNKNRFNRKDDNFILSIPVIFNSLSISISEKFFNDNILKFNFKQQGVTTRKEKFYDIITNEFKYENFHTHAKPKIYSRYESDDKNLDKILICLSGEYKAIIDLNKKSHTGMSCVDFLSAENSENINILLNSKLYKFIMNKLYKYNGWVNMKCVQNLPKPNIIFNKKELTENDIYKYFNLTEEEIKLIEDTV